MYVSIVEFYVYYQYFCEVSFIFPTAVSLLSWSVVSLLLDLSTEGGESGFVDVHVVRIAKEKAIIRLLIHQLDGVRLSLDQVRKGRQGGTPVHASEEVDEVDILH